ncbi:hypothetical protein B4Q04_21775 [Zobellia sp. OII3]|uniref:DUF6920 family protein n=1 Tax=Zobellia sp. OII3 TaxID=2034520 RepID=UPI000B52B456|nr:DUF6544 family protein [Zobellia sp. OII3]OWW23244.1 hypothetical protein B4Q04_21775 [Zobellia sp. OII3]
MRIVFVLLLILHGLIHLFGFLKAFGLSEFNAIQQPISRPMGLLWLLAFVLFGLTALRYLKPSELWWIFGFLAVVLSQFLIISFWADAKFGTLFNVVVLAVALAGYGSFAFRKKVHRETREMLSQAHSLQKAPVSKEMVSEMPPVVQKWLLNSGTIGKEPAGTVYLQQDLQMQMKPGQNDWIHARAEQYFTAQPPAFNWSVRLKMNPILALAGRDKFENGKGEMSIKLFSLFSMVDAKNNAKTNEATLQRYLAEIVWFPSNALQNYITWEPIDGTSAKATMRYKGTQGSGVFHFDENGNFVKFTAMRYKDAQDTRPTEWTVTAIKTERHQGIKIPVELKADWKLGGTTWTWLKVKIRKVEYPLPQNTKN